MAPGPSEPVAMSSVDEEEDAEDDDEAGARYGGVVDGDGAR